jgi:PIN domain nuclease of toxin-antitoxin system
LPEECQSWLQESVQALRLREIPLTSRVAAELQTLTIGHHNPAGRILLAPAKVFDLALLTEDERLIETPGRKLLANR